MSEIQEGGVKAIWTLYELEQLFKTRGLPETLLVGVRTHNGCFLTSTSARAAQPAR